MRYSDDPRNPGRIVRSRNDLENFNNLLEGRIDAFPVDELVGATLAWRHGWKGRVLVSSNSVFEAPIHVMFSQQTSTPALVEQFKQSLAKMSDDGEYSRVIRDYLLPVLLG